MEKRLNLMVNKIVTYFFISIFFILLLYSCVGSNKQHQFGADKVSAVNDKAFIPDTIVNGVLKLSDYRSAELFYESVGKLSPIDFLRESPVIPFCNASKNKYMLAYQYEGDTRNSFGCIEIGYCDTIPPGCTVLLKYDEFATESGLRLGMSLNDLERIKGNNYVKNKDKVIYKIDYQTSDFLQKYNMPEYVLECTFSNDKIVKIKFGFVYP